MAHDVRQLKRIQWDIVCRLVAVIHDSPRSKRTTIAMKSGLAYDNCISYLDWMETMDLIGRELDEGFQVIRLTEKGNSLYMKQRCKILDDLEDLEEIVDPH